MDERETTQGDPSRPAPYPPAYLPPAGFPRPVKSPGIALMLSMVMPGIGQVYNGQINKALAFFFGFGGAIFAAAEGAHFFGLVIPFVYFWTLVDAYRSAAAINARAAGRSEIEEEEAKVESPAWGAALILIGLVLLLHNLGWLRLWQLERYWPLLLIAAGGVLLYRTLRRKETGSGRVL